MGLTLSILPLVLLIAAMTLRAPRLRLPAPAYIALPCAAVMAYGIQMWSGAVGVNASGAPKSALVIHARVIDGLLSSLAPLAIVFGAVLLFKTMEVSGAMGVLTSRLRRLSGDAVAQVMLVGWSFSFLVEGLSGFGTPAALAAPVLVGLGFPVVRVAAACLVMNSVPVSFGAVGTPTWFGLGEVGLSQAELLEVGWRTAIVHALAAPVAVWFGLRLLLDRKVIAERAWFIALVVIATVAPYLAAARFGTEFPSIIGGACGLIAAAVMASRGIGLPRAEGPRIEETRGSRLSLWRAAFPLAATVVVLGATRIEALGIKGLLTSATPEVSVRVGGLGEAHASGALVVGLRDILGTGVAWKMPLLYVPFIVPFVVVALAAAPILRMRGKDAARAVGASAMRLVRPAVALGGGLLLVKMLMAGGESAPAMVIGRALASGVGAVSAEAWPSVAPLLGALGSFFSGSNTVSNLTYAPVQDAVAARLGLDRVTVLAMQSAGGAMGNMVCIHNIVAVAAVLGIRESAGRGDEQPGGVVGILRLTVGPMLIYAGIAAGAGALLTVL